MIVWVVMGHSESGDDYGPVVYEKEPGDEILKTLCWAWDPPDVEDDDAPGDYGTYVAIHKSKCEVLL